MGSAPPKEELIANGAMTEDGTLIVDHQTLEQGTTTQIVAAFDPALIGHNGDFLEDSKIQNDKNPANSRTEETADRLWESSEKLWGIKF